MNLSQRDLTNLYGQLGLNEDQVADAVSDHMVRYGEEPYHLNSFFLHALIVLTKRVKELEDKIKENAQ